MACGKKGIRNVIIESGGFTEFDEGKKVLEEQIQAIARQYGMHVIGPNCFGAIIFNRSCSSLLCPQSQLHEEGLRLPRLPERWNLL